jgi:hypothetical protein
MDSNDLKTLQKRVARTKRDLKKWESVFEQKHDRPPTIKDIGQRPNIGKPLSFYKTKNAILNYLIEKFYKKYNHLKKELKKETEVQESLSAASSPSIIDTQSTSTSPHRQPERKSSVEFERSPSHPMSHMKSVFQQEGTSLSIRRASEIEQFKAAMTASSSTSTIASQGTNASQGERQLTEDEAFWLGVTPTSTTATPTSSPPPSSQPRLILGGSQPNKKRSTKPVYRRRRQMLITQSQPLPEQTQHPLISNTTSSQPNNNRPVYNNFMEEEEDDDDMEGIEIVNHEVNHFRHYDPSLFHWDDPTFSVGPGFFSSKACTSFMIPILKDSARRDRVLKKLAKGTLGEVLAENQAMEEDLDEEMREFIANNTIIDPNVR